MTGDGDTDSVIKWPFMPDRSASTDLLKQIAHALGQQVADFYDLSAATLQHQRHEVLEIFDQLGTGEYRLRALRALRETVQAEASFMKMAAQTRPTRDDDETSR